MKIGRQRSSPATFIGQIAQPAPGRAAHVGLQPLALEAGAAELERRARLGLSHDAAKPSLHQRAQRDPLALGKLASLTKKRVRNFYGRLHSPYGWDLLSARPYCASESRRQAARVSASRGLDRVATCSYTVGMKTVSIREAKNRLTELAREVERGETILVTRNGSPVLELTPHRPRKGLRLGAIDEFKRKHGVEEIVAFIADGFDDPLPEDFLLRPLPSDA